MTKATNSAALRFGFVRVQAPCDTTRVGPYGVWAAIADNRVESLLAGDYKGFEA
jgi:hypothetical protein